MSQDDNGYYATLCRLDSDNQDTHIDMDPNAVRLGTLYHLEHETYVNERGKEFERVVVTGDDGRSLGFLPVNVARRVMALADEGWLCHIIPTLVVYSKREEAYWLEAAVVCYAAKLKAPLDVFLEKLRARIAAGDHPEVKLSAAQLEQVLEREGEWSGFANAPLPALGKTAAIYKSGQTKTEKLANAAIEHTTGCYLAMAAVTIAVVAVAVWFFFLR